MLLLGSLGAMVNWLISPANSLAQAAKHAPLIHHLSQHNKHQVPQKMLILQAIIVSVLCSVFFLLPSLNGAVWFLLDLSTQIYVLMYLILFISALLLFTKSSKEFTILKHKKCAQCIALLGIIGTLMTLVVGFIPPSSINVGSSLYFEALFALGLLLMIAPCWFIVKGHKKIKSA